MDFSFSVNSYDSDGDIVDDGIFIHLYGIAVRFKDVSELEEFANSILKSLPEIRENIKSKNY